MQKEIRSTAVMFAVMFFFILSFVGWFCGLSPATCCSRGFLGAIIIYITVTIAGRSVMAIIIRSIIEGRALKTRKDNNQ
jgi:hypothetical protein